VWLVKENGCGKRATSREKAFCASENWLIVRAPSPLGFSQVFILKEVKVACFDALSQVLILKGVGASDLSRALWINEKDLGGAAPISRVFAYEWQGKNLRDRECVRVAGKGLTDGRFLRFGARGIREARWERKGVADRDILPLA
jgi:hypothetical protein